MDELRSNPMDRRVFLQAGVAASAAAAGMAAGDASAQDARGGAGKSVLPTRKLGKTGVEVTLLNHGTVGEPAGLGRLLRSAYLEGVRYFDTAEGYKNSERVIGEWLTAAPEVRKTIFLATKSHVKTQSECSRSSTSGSTPSRPTTSTCSSSTGSTPPRPTGPGARS